MRCLPTAYNRRLGTPPTINDERLPNLIRSIQADPDFLWRRAILATAAGTIYTGNKRYRAAQHLGMATLPVIIESIDPRIPPGRCPFVCPRAAKRPLGRPRSDAVERVKAALGEVVDLLVRLYVGDMQLGPGLASSNRPWRSVNRQARILSQFSVPAGMSAPPAEAKASGLWTRGYCHTSQSPCTSAQPAT